jgi:pimeloyl-ACP methyl ester carboxylesterase
MPIIRSGDADISYEVTGSGEPLLMIMGFLSDSRMWMLQTPEFSQHFQCITFDNRGVGNSSRPQGPYTMEQMAADAIAVLDDAGIDKVNVLGISMGGAIAQHVALKIPERINKLVLAATWCRPNQWLDRLGTISNDLTEHLGPEVFGRSVLLWLFTPELVINHPGVIEMIETMMSTIQPPVESFASQFAAVQAHDTEAQLHQITAPTLVMGARRDFMVPPELAKHIADAIPGSRFEMLEGGHGFSAENTAEFNRVILEFLTSQ